MKSITKVCITVLLYTIISTGEAKAQFYLGCGLGYAFKPDEGKSPIMSLHGGFQVNNVLIPNGVALMEYNQRIVVGGRNPAFLGGRVGFGLKSEDEVRLVSLWGARYYRLYSSGNKELNYWVPGYGVSFYWKNATLEVSKVEFFHISIGCRFLFDNSEY